MRNFILAFSVLVFLSGCTKQEAKTKEYYKEHLDEAKVRVEECKKLETYNEVEQIDCSNAESAIFFHSKPKNDYGKSNPDAFKQW